MTVTTARSSIAASDVYGIRQTIEGFNIADLGWGTANAQTVTISFWARSSITGTYTVSLFNTAFNRSYVATYTISAANTFEYKTITIAGDTTGTWATDNSGGINLYFDLGSGSNFQTTAGAWGASGYLRTSGSANWISTNGATFYITGVQLEKGSQATAFEWRPYGAELALCKMYYRKLGGESIADVIIQGYTTTGQAIGCTIALDSGMRASPSVTRQGTWTDVSSGTFVAYPSKTSIGLQYSPSSTGATGTYTNGGSLILTAEL
jgi:hypothetical protein